MANFPQDFILKNTPNEDDLIILADSQDLDLWGNPKSDKKSKLSSLWVAIFGTRSADDIPEWTTNEYYTDAKVSSSTLATDVWNALDDKADIVNVLTKDNTDSYTPTAPNHPATKKYVDDIGTITKATETQASARTNNTNFITPFTSYVVVPWTKTLASLDGTPVVTTSAIYVKIKEILLPKGWTYSVSFEAIKSISGTGNARIYVNDGAVGTERTITFWDPSGIYDEDIVVPNNWLLQLYVKTNNTPEEITTNYMNVLYSTDPIVPYTVNLT